MATQTIPIGTETHDMFPINGTDYIEFYVGNAKQAAHYLPELRSAFSSSAYRGPETGVRDRVSYLLVQDKIRLVLTSALGPDGDDRRPRAQARRRRARHRSLGRRRARRLRESVERGAESAYEPRVQRDDDGEVVSAGIKIYGDTIHSLVERKNYRGTVLPGLPEPRAALSGRRRRDCCTSTTASATSSSGR